MAMPSYDVSAIGLYILDILGRPIESIPPGGRAQYIDEISLVVAGTGGGTAVACAILGLRTRAVTAVGDDTAGAFLLDSMARHGIDLTMVERLPGVATSATILPVRPNGERPAWHVPGSAAMFTVPEEAMDAALDAGIVHVGGTGLLRSFDGEPARRVLARAKGLGRTTTFDLIQATEETLGLVEPLLPHIDYFLPSIEEASAMSGLTAPDDVARFFLDRGVGVCALTMGGEGSLVMTADGARLRLPAFDVPVVDTSGCGDSYTAGFIAGLHRGWDLERCARLATATSALVATGLGSNACLTSFEATAAAMTTLTPRPLEDAA